MKMTKTITISGGFHNVREVTVQAKIDPRGGITLSTGQIRKIGNHMCGITGCICGMHHRWVIGGSDRAELSKAFQDAQVVSYLNSSRNS